MLNISTCMHAPHARLVAHRGGRPKPGVDARAGPGAERAVLGLGNVGAQRWDLLKQLVLRQVAPLLPCTDIEGCSQLWQQRLHR